MFPNRTSEFDWIAEFKIPNEQIIKRICKIEENKIVFLNWK